jgi:hypothetical protein
VQYDLCTPDLQKQNSRRKPKSPSLLVDAVTRAFTESVPEHAAAIWQGESIRGDPPNP